MACRFFSLILPELDNSWTTLADLAAARASSVVQELSKSGKIPSEKLRAISFGETRPIEQNDTEQGREKNRRIEIEINY